MRTDLKLVKSAGFRRLSRAVRAGALALVVGAVAAGVLVPTGWRPGWVPPPGYRAQASVVDSTVIR